MITVSKASLASVTMMFPLLSTTLAAGSIADIEHVILFMQENRAFDHYFGTMAGVRGFSDPNVQVNPVTPSDPNSGKPIWYQDVDSSLTNASEYLLPWWLNYQGGDWLEATQCMIAGDNGWDSNHAALNGDLNNHWATNNTPWSWGHWQRSDIPVQFAIAEGWTVGDMYQESIIAMTNPNRVAWVSGSINVPGSPQSADEGGYPYIDNNETPGCDADGINCYPLLWKTVPEFYQDAGVTWQVFQDRDNFDDNPLAWFGQYQDAAEGTPLSNHGMSYLGLEDFYSQAANGTLPAISYIVGPMELSEHPPFSPRDGAWLQKQVVDAVTNGAKYSSSVLMISYDETGGFGDHVTPYHSPEGTAGEWLEDPYSEFGYTYAGPGYRLPFYIISPWTRGGTVFTEYADHNSQILFIEEWLAAKGKNVTTDQMVPWRRQHMSNLVSAFDFSAPDFSLPDLPKARAPHTDDNGDYDGASFCEATYAVQRPPVPYGNQSTDVSSLSEQGFKPVRGSLTEGRYLTFEYNGYALSNTGSPATDLVATRASNNHSDISQRWVVHQVLQGGNAFTISSAKDGRYLGNDTTLVNSPSEAGTYSITFVSGRGYSLAEENGQYVTIDGSGSVQITGAQAFFEFFSVTYHS